MKNERDTSLFQLKDKSSVEVTYGGSIQPSFKERLRKAWKSNKLFTVISILILIIIVLSIFSGWITMSPDQVDVANPLRKPGGGHLLGTDHLGRDVFARALYGGKVSLTVALFAMAISVIFGTFVGMISGYYGGWVDTVIMRIVDALLSIPSLVVIIVMGAIISPGIPTLVMMIAVFSWMGVAKIIRGRVLTLRERDYVQAARGLGISDLKIMFVHILPNLASEIIVAATVCVARAILQESTLSYLGYGVALPKASWGGMLKEAQPYLMQSPEQSLVPGVLILIVVLFFNLVGDFFKSVWNPGKGQ